MKRIFGIQLFSGKLFLPAATAAAAAARGAAALSHNPDEDDVSVRGWEHISPIAVSREMITQDSNKQISHCNPLCRTCILTEPHALQPPNGNM